MIVKCKENPKYQLDSEGYVIGCKCHRPLRPQHDQKGYAKVRLYDSVTWKDYYIHRLIGEAFLEKPTDDEEYDIIHIDGDKNNNSVDNLCYIKHDTLFESLHKEGLFDEVKDKLRTKLIQLNSDGEIIGYFDSIRDAAIWLKNNRNHDSKVDSIITVLRPKINSHKLSYGYYWELN